MAHLSPSSAAALLAKLHTIDAAQSDWEAVASSKHEGRVFYRHRITRQVTWVQPTARCAHLAMAPSSRVTRPSDALQRLLHVVQELVAEMLTPYTAARHDGGRGEGATPCAVLELLPGYGHSEFLAHAAAHGATRRMALVARVESRAAQALLQRGSCHAMGAFQSPDALAASLASLRRHAPAPLAADAVVCFAPVNLVWPSPADGRRLLRTLAAELHPVHGRLCVVHLDDGALRRGVAAARGDHDAFPCATVAPGDCAQRWWTPARQVRSGGPPLSFRWQAATQQPRAAPLAVFPCSDHGLWHAAHDAGLQASTSWDLWSLWHCVLANAVPAPALRARLAAPGTQAAMQQLTGQLTAHEVQVLRALRLSSFLVRLPGGSGGGSGGGGGGMGASK